MGADTDSLVESSPSSSVTAASSAHFDSTGVPQTAAMGAPINDGQEPDTTGFLELAFESVPTSAAVYLNGRRIGFTPLSHARYKAGKYEIRIAAFGYQPAIDTVVLRSGVRRKIVAKLSKISPALQIISTPSEATVFIKQKQVGITPYRDSLLDSGWYRIRLEKDGFLPAETRYFFVGKRADTLSIRLISKAKADSIRQVRLNRVRWGSRIVAGSLTAGCIALGAYHNSQYEKLVDEGEQLKAEYDKPSQSLTRYDDLWRQIEEKSSQISERKSKRNWSYGLAGIFSLSFVLTFAF